MGDDVKKLGVFITRKKGAGSIWVRAGVAISNRDGSWNVHLDALPIDGQLHLRAEAPPQTSPGGADLDDVISALQTASETCVPELEGDFKAALKMAQGWKR